MAALVQSYPQQSGTVTMLQTRPSSASGILQSSSQASAHHQYAPNLAQVHRNSFHGMSNSMAPTYRGHTTLEPIAPYAFTRTPALLPSPRTASGPHLRPEQRSSSALGVPTYDSGAAANRSRYPAAASISTASSSSSSDLSPMGQKAGSKDDLSTPARTANGTPQLIMSTSASLAPQVASTTTKISPDRYRRPNNRRAESATVAPSNSFGSSMPNVKQFYGSSTQQVTPALNNAKQGSAMPATLALKQTLARGGVAADDMQLNLLASKDQAAKYRRRSIHTIEADRYSYDGVNPLGGLQQQGSRQVSSANGRIDHQQQQHPLRSSPMVALRPGSSHGRNNSSDSVDSTRSSHRSRPNSAKRDTNPSSMATVNPAPSSSSLSASLLVNQTSRNDIPKLINIPLRGSSSEAAKRVANPSPLSKPMAMTPESLTSKDSFASAVTAALHAPSKPTYAQVVNGAKASSPAAKQLAAVSDKDGKKNKTSRLRRAFSFGSAAELRKASAENSAANNAIAAAAAADKAKLAKDKDEDEQEAEQARIAERQEAAGIGSGIYSGQGNFFSGSTDNISISSTASSASIMIRKMGKGMKKSTRSLVGLFRPKSIVGAPADTAPPEVSQAQVSMVTVEAEREKVNVNANPHDHVGGGTGFPKLERNSVDAVAAGSVNSERLGSSGTEDSGARRSIVGGEKERAEVLAAVKKGILKRTGTDSGNVSPVIRPEGDSKSPSFQLPHIPHVNDSPASSTPSTPNDEQQGHRRTGSVTLGGEDYFMSALRFQGNSKSVPSTPPGAKRNATFSPRIQFHDTWPSGEYDRRGDIATCNRLTPMLAQQIKEELNTFKMEMEVHENSKIYTHFF